MNIVGLDPSLTSTGLCLIDGTTLTLTPPKGRDRGPARLSWISAEIAGRILAGPANPPDLVAIEGYSRGSSNRREEMGELGGIVRVLLYSYGIPYIEIAPMSLKKFAVGHAPGKKLDDGTRAKVGKDEMLAAAVRAGADVTRNDAADAWWLRQFALHRYGGADVEWRTYRDEAVAGVKEWPEL